MSFGSPGWSMVGNLTTVVNPTLTNEFIFGSSRNDLHITPIDSAFIETSMGLSYKMPFPNADPLHLVQNWRRYGLLYKEGRPSGTDEAPGRGKAPVPAHPAGKNSPELIFGTDQTPSSR